MKLLEKVQDLLKNVGKNGEQGNLSLTPGKSTVSKDPSPGKFILITGIGHCGTAWLAYVLHRPANGMVCYHEHKNHITGVDWKASLQHEANKGIDELFDPYWIFMKNQQKHYQAVGDSNSWTMYIIPEVAKKIHIDHIIYLVRNGIQNVHSSFYRNTNLPRNDWLYTHFFRQYWELLNCPGGDWGTYTDWACWCLWWQVNKVMPDWLAERLGVEKITVYRLEDLLQNTEMLLRLIRKVNPFVRISQKEIKTLQQTDINRKIQGDRSLEALWAKWTDEQREVFTHICSSTMERYGYRILPSP